MPTLSFQISLTDPAGSIMVSSCIAEVAQPVEQRTENPCVDGSIPSLGTTNRKESRLVVYRSKAGFLLRMTIVAFCVHLVGKLAPQLAID